MLIELLSRIRSNMTTRGFESGCDEAAKDAATKLSEKALL
jgi:hypothetical protein